METGKFISLGRRIPSSQSVHSVLTLIGRPQHEHAPRFPELAGQGSWHWGVVAEQYAGPVLSRAELKSCVEQERQINAGMNELDRQEAYLNQQHVFVNHYSPQSVDNYNRLVNEFNARSAQVNAQASHFNASCANHAYYESDMMAVRTELGAE